MKHRVRRWLGIEYIMDAVDKERRESHAEHHRIARRLELLEREILDMAATLDGLKAQVTALESITEQVLVKLGEPGVSQSDIDGVTTQVQAVVDKLTSAIAPLQP